MDVVGPVRGNARTWIVIRWEQWNTGWKVSSKSTVEWAKCDLVISYELEVTDHTLYTPLLLSMKIKTMVLYSFSKNVLQIIELWDDSSRFHSEREMTLPLPFRVGTLPMFPKENGPEKRFLHQAQHVEGYPPGGHPGPCPLWGPHGWASVADKWQRCRTDLRRAAGFQMSTGCMYCDRVCLYWKEMMKSNPHIDVQKMIYKQM